MAKVNLDSMFEPIEFQLNGKDYRIESLSQEVIDQVTEAAGQGNGIAGVVKQFSILTGIDVQEAAKIDIRKIKAALELIMKEISASPKNA